MPTDYMEVAMAKRFSTDYDGWVRALKMYLAFRILVRCAMRRETITYVELGRMIRTNQLHLGRRSRPIRDYCERNRLPRLIVLIVEQHSGEPGQSYPYQRESIPADREAVFGCDWLDVAFPSVEELKGQAS